MTGEAPHEIERLLLTGSFTRSCFVWGLMRPLSPSSNSWLSVTCCLAPSWACGEPVLAMLPMEFKESGQLAAAIAANGELDCLGVCGNMSDISSADKWLPVSRCRE